MQITANKGSMVLDYYPIKDWNDNRIVDKFLRILSFRGETMTKRIVSSQTLENEVVDRCDNYGYKVTQFNTIRQYVSNTND
jgi:hypothetical protein